MNELAHFYFDLLTNIFQYFTICLLVKNHTKTPLAFRQHLYCIPLYILISIPATIPYRNLTIALLNLIVLLILSFPYLQSLHLFERLKRFTSLAVKFVFLTQVAYFIIRTTHTLLMFDIHNVSENIYYAQCKTTICTALLYILYALYLNGKRMKKLNLNYRHIFTLVIMLILITLSFLTLYICRTQTFYGPVIPILFTAMFPLILLCINIYKHFVDLIEKNVSNEFLVRQSKITAGFSKQIEDNLKELHGLRHDIRNHLIILDGYASKSDFASIHTYIEKITENYTDVPLFDTPSTGLSALLNAKHQFASNKGINFVITYDFPYLHIDDFPIITIIGNLIDNAIAASEKCSNGAISLSIIQHDSYLNIQIRNNHVEQITEQNGVFISSKKKDGLFHGLGIKNVRSTVEQLNGQIEITYDDATFSVDILIPNY